MLKILYIRFYKKFSLAAIVNQIFGDHIKKGLSLEPDPEFTEKSGSFWTAKLNYSKITNSRLIGMKMTGEQD